MQIHGLILAAGFSRRMGAFKPLLRIGEQTLLETSVQSMLAGGAMQVTVVLGHRSDECAALLRSTFPPEQVRVIINPDYATTDMLASFHTGLAGLPACDAFYLLPGDMPAIAPETYRRLALAMAQSGAMVVFPTVEDRRKHPPLIATEAIPALLAYQGETGLRGAWDGFAGNTAEVAVTDEGCTLDADTEADFERLKAYLASR